MPLGHGMGQYLLIHQLCLLMLAKLPAELAPLLVLLVKLMLDGLGD